MKVLRRSIRTGLAAMPVVMSMAAGDAAAQAMPVVSVEATTEENRRGLSWSEGRASASADLFAQIGRVEATARVAALRNAVRHGQSDAVVDLGLASGWTVAGFALRAQATGHLFVGGQVSGGQAGGGQVSGGSTAGKEEPLNYGEFGGSASYSYGPVRLQAGANFAPHQGAIGGSNLHLFADMSAGIPATPLTVVAGIGRSSGDSDGTGRANRLRPGGTYVNWRLGVEHVRGPLSIAVDYVGTDIERDDAPAGGYDNRHDGNRLIARARYSF